MTPPPLDIAAQVGPSRWWYGVPAMLVVVGTIASILLLTTAYDRFSGVSRELTDGVVSVGQEQLSVFADVPAAAGAAAPSTGPAACTLTPLTGGPELATEGSGVSMTYTQGERRWVRIGLVPSGAAPGAYELRCAGFGPGDLAVGSTDGIASGALYVVAGIVVPIVALVLAIVAFVVVIVLRTRSRNRLRREAAHAAGQGGPSTLPA